MRERRKTGVVAELQRGIKYIGARMLQGGLLLRYASMPTQSNLVLLESFHGTRLDCNPRAIYEYLQAAFHHRYRYVWVAERPEDWADLAARPDTEVVRYRSSEHWKYACLASVLVTNGPRSNELPARWDQLQIQTWHGGGCYKKVGTALHTGMPIQRYITERQFHRYNYFISSSAFFSREVVRGQYAFAGTILECGMPRNDRLVRNDASERVHIRKELGLSESDALVLYAPTWRDFAGEAQGLDVAAVRAAVVKRFERNVIMAFRGHYFSGFASEDFDCSLNDYRDMQGLLLACDVVITDYSSLIWDYSFTYRPCFLYTPDLAQYEADRGFDVDIHKWGFPVCETTEQLVKAIMDFVGVDFRQRMERHHEALGSFETGHACEAVAHIINEHCGFGKELAS